MLLCSIEIPRLSRVYATLQHWNPQVVTCLCYFAALPDGVWFHVNSSFSPSRSHVHWWRSSWTQRDHIHNIFCIWNFHYTPNNYRSKVGESSAINSISETKLHIRSKYILWSHHILPYELLSMFLFHRLPIIQGATFSFLTPTFTILALEKWQCPYNLAAKGMCMIYWFDLNTFYCMIFLQKD